jgi:hypothetical protein
MRACVTWTRARIPRGRGRHEALHATVAALDTVAGQRTGAAPGSWADGRTWIVAVDPAAERLERRVRRLITRSLLCEAAVLRARGTRVTVLTPGPEDLAAMGANVMDPRRRQPVLDISLRTSAATLAAADGHPHVA